MVEPRIVQVLIIMSTRTFCCLRNSCLKKSAKQEYFRKPVLSKTIYETVYPSKTPCSGI